ncbi:unnamed protein product, partial [marine sediment metagenome]
IGIPPAETVAISIFCSNDEFTAKELFEIRDIL